MILIRHNHYYFATPCLFLRPLYYSLELCFKNCHLLLLWTWEGKLMILRFYSVLHNKNNVPSIPFNVCCVPMEIMWVSKEDLGLGKFWVIF
jgi:hypothetical protein